jgi:hypothetical protein
MKIIGFDFSINKPAACIYENGRYEFYSWPFGLSEKIKELYRNSGVHLFDRTDEKYKGSDSSEKMRQEVSNSIYLSDFIISSFPDGNYFSKSPIVFEGLSFGSSGNVVLQLGGYKYILMKSLYDEGVPFSNMTTYAPITLKKTAGASKKGMGKKEMIESFISSGVNNSLRNAIEKDPSLFQKKTGTWIDHLDDLVDSFWAIETYREKNGI